MKEKVMRRNAVREDKVKIRNQEVENVEEFVYFKWDKGFKNLCQCVKHWSSHITDFTSCVQHKSIILALCH